MCRSARRMATWRIAISKAPGSFLGCEALETYMKTLEHPFEIIENM